MYTKPMMKHYIIYKLVHCVFRDEVLHEALNLTNGTGKERTRREEFKKKEQVCRRAKQVYNFSVLLNLLSPSETENNGCLFEKLKPIEALGVNYVI
jgi:hypothetical protein